MRDNITIRSAIPEDIPQLLPLMEQLGYSQERQEFEERVTLFIQQSSYGIAVAEEGRILKGFIAWSHRMCLVAPCHRIRIEGLIVNAAYRRQGIGKILMRFVEKAVEILRPCVIELTSGLHRAKDGSHDFYKTLGYHNDDREAKIYLRKTLS